ncbi:MAG TPA: hypothetical protein VIC00_05050, partial [Candidatus Acidoferrales bacterium]
MLGEKFAAERDAAVKHYRCEIGAAAPFLLRPARHLWKQYSRYFSNHMKQRIIRANGADFGLIIGAFRAKLQELQQAMKIIG